MSDHMRSEFADLELVTVSKLIKLFSEKYKIVSDNKRHCLDGLRQLVWLFATTIALNYFSLNSTKIFGLWPFKEKFNDLYFINTIFLSFGLLKIILFILKISTETPFRCVFPKINCEAEEIERGLLNDFVRTISNDMATIESAKDLIRWSVRWLTSGFALSMLPISISLYLKYFGKS